MGLELPDSQTLCRRTPLSAIVWVTAQTRPDEEVMYVIPSSEKGSGRGSQDGCPQPCSQLPLCSSVTCGSPGGWGQMKDERQPPDLSSLLLVVLAAASHSIRSGPSHPWERASESSQGSTPAFPPSHSPNT